MKTVKVPHHGRKLTALRPKQSLGQNFLIDDNIARKIVRSMNLKPDDVVVEVGPGKGALTKFLADTGAHILAVEIDGRLVDDLRALVPSDRVAILHADFLDVSLDEISRTHHSRIRLAGNLPYHLTSSILFKSFDERASIRDLTIMVQREVAHRIVARPSTKEYGILAVLAQAFSRPELLFTVSPNCFFPRPKVDSAVLRLDFSAAPPFRVDEKIFTLVVKTTFGKRRKTLRNSLTYLPFDLPVIEQILREHPDLLGRRPEELSVAEFAAFAGSVARIAGDTADNPAGSSLNKT